MSVKSQREQDSQFLWKRLQQKRWQLYCRHACTRMSFISFTCSYTCFPIAWHLHFFFRFLAETPGTHFWHAHAGLQRADGVFGALVIRQPKSRDYHSALYDHDLPEHTILLNDWIGEMGASRFAGHHHAMTEHLPESILINGW